uniref:Uncharacterized protein n=3 Tax=Schistocephalus solidus TaxID=70667 RepID=A0A0X3PSE5_SCHSO
MRKFKRCLLGVLQPEHDKIVHSRSELVNVLQFSGCSILEVSILILSFVNVNFGLILLLYHGELRGFSMTSFNSSAVFYYTNTWKIDQILFLAGTCLSGLFSMEVSIRIIYLRKRFAQSPLEVVDSIFVFVQICAVIVLTIIKANIVICDACLCLSLFRLVRLPRLCFGLTNQESGKYRQTIAYFQREESFHQHTVNNLQHRLDLNEVEINQLRQAFQALQAGESFSVEDSIYGGMHNSSLPVMGLDLSFANDSCQRLPPLNETFSLSQTHLSPFDVKQANNIYLRDEASRIQHTNFQSDCKELNGVQNRAYEGELDTGAELRELHRRLEHCGNWVQKCDPDEQESAF